MVKRSFVHDGLVREFWTYLPSRTGSRLPMVMALHGYTGTAQGFEAWTHMNAHAEQHGYVVVYPQSTGFMGVYPGRGEMLITSWNDLSSSPPTGPEGESCVLEERTYPCPPECSACGTCNWGSCHDDLGFLERIIDYSIASACVAPSRVYATGFSNGGMMSQQVGCSLSDRFAAVAPVAGFLHPGFGCAPASPTSLIQLYGDDDRVLPGDGTLSYDGYRYTSADESAKRWAAALACDATPSPMQTPQGQIKGLACRAHAHCAGAQEVVTCQWSMNDHTWPGTHSDRPWGLDLVWWFFQRHERSSK